MTSAAAAATCCIRLSLAEEAVKAAADTYAVLCMLSSEATVEVGTG